MLYCKDCKTVSQESACDKCGNKKLREASENDPVFLTVKDVIWAGLVEDVLNDNQIPYKMKGVLGAGLSVKLGMVFERYIFYVPYGAYSKAASLLEELFPPEGSEPDDEASAPEPDDEASSHDSEE